MGAKYWARPGLIRRVAVGSCGVFVYYLNMASVQPKVINGKTYYYLVESARVGGKPRIVSQRYLGSAQDITAALDGASSVPTRTRHLGFGALAATWAMLARLDYPGIVDAVVGARRADAGASVGTYLGLACANRVVAPRSKLAFARWWDTTAGDRWVSLPAGASDHRRFWDAMDTLDADRLVEVERHLATAMTSKFGLGLSGMALDMTNFATFIDSTNDKAPSPSAGTPNRNAPIYAWLAWGRWLHTAIPSMWCAVWGCLLYTSDAADDLTRVDLGGRRIIKKK